MHFIKSLKVHVSNSKSRFLCMLRNADTTQLLRPNSNKLGFEHVTKCAELELLVSDNVQSIAKYHVRKI